MNSNSLFVQPHRGWPSNKILNGLCLELGGSLPKSFRFRLRGEGNNCLNCSLNLPEYRCIYPQGAEKETEGKGLTFVQQTFFVLFVWHSGWSGLSSGWHDWPPGTHVLHSLPAVVCWHCPGNQEASHCVDLSIGTLHRHLSRADVPSTSYPWVCRVPSVCYSKPLGLSLSSNWEPSCIYSLFLR